ncbi:MAG: esterase [Chelatococcus sp.]|nr:MAG: esterase [Chelatococcus sp.]
MSNPLGLPSPKRALWRPRRVGANPATPAGERTGVKRTRPRPAWLLPAVLLMLAGCSSRPESVLLPVAAAAGESARVGMLVVTTRQPADDPGQLYSGERGSAVSFDSLDVSIPPARNRKLGEIQWPGRIPADPEHDFAVLATQKVASEPQLLDWFRKHRNRRRQALIFVHGFNNTYADAVFRLAQIKHDAGIDAAPILFTWPSRASVFDYLYDKESTTYSRRALEDLIIKAAKSPDVGEITILAHSMGTWLTMEALRGAAMREHALPAKVDNVVLASPDIDVDVFRRQIIEMGPKLPRFTILTSTADKALGISRLISGGVNRVGGADPRPYEDILKQLGITVIDTSTSDSKDPLGHNAFADSPQIIALLGRTLAGQSLQPGQENLADSVGIVAVGTAGLAGAAAKAALSIPRHMLENRLTAPKSPIVNGRASY